MTGDIITADQLWLASLCVLMLLAINKQAKESTEVNRKRTTVSKKNPLCLPSQIESQMSSEKWGLNANVCAGSCAVFQPDSTEQCVADRNASSLLTDTLISGSDHLWGEKSGDYYHCWVLAPREALRKSFSSS